MLTFMWHLREQLRFLRNQHGAETAEWILIVGLLVVVAVAIYSAPASPLLTGLTNVVNSVVAAITAALPAP